MKSILISKFQEDNGLELLAGKEGLNKVLTVDEISRPGLEFTGFFDFFDNKRIVLVGSKDAAFLGTLPLEVRKKNLDHLFSLNPPCLVFSKNVKIDPLFYEMADKYDIALFRTKLRTTPSSSKLFTYLQDHFAERLSIHGTLMDINGMGTLIIGKSGIGKSETALDLIKRGHQLIADDLVEIIEKEPGNLIGTSPEILRRYMEIRGIGIVDVVTMFGASSYRDRKNIRLVVELETWDETKYYDRLGLESEKIKYFNTEIAKVTIPVLPGRTVALLVESAAMNEKLKLLGHNAAIEFVSKVDNKAMGKEE